MKLRERECDGMSGPDYTQSLFSNWLKLIGLPMGAMPFSLAPSELHQAVNPWTFGNFYYVSSANSGSPGTETAITAKASYGRQLGRVMDVLVDLITEKPEADQTAVDEGFACAPSADRDNQGQPHR
jgi:hypothetical protein